MRVLLQVAAGRREPETIAIEAVDRPTAHAQATERGYTVLDDARPSLVGSADRSAHRLDSTIFVEQLRDLLAAGLGVVEALGTLRRGSSGAAARTLQALEQRLHEGAALSEAIERVGVLPPLLVALVRTSEVTSNLAQTLTRYLEHERRVADVRHRIASAAIYPALLMSVGGAVLLFLLFYVAPRFARVFEGMSGDLPWTARLMIGWSELLHRTGPLGATVALLASLMVSAAVATPRGRAAAARRLLDRTLLRRRLRPYYLARWYRATGLLIEGGIPLSASLGLSNDLLPPAFRSGASAVALAVRQGLSPAQAYARAGMATPVSEQLMIAGERTGDLGAVLQRIAQVEEADVTRTLERTMRALEPLVMATIGLGVGLVVVLMYLPIFELASAIP